MFYYFIFLFFLLSGALGRILFVKGAIQVLGIIIIIIIIIIINQNIKFI